MKNLLVSIALFFLVCGFSHANEIREGMKIVEGGVIAKSFQLQVIEQDFDYFYVELNFKYVAADGGWIYLGMRNVTDARAGCSLNPSLNLVQFEFRSVLGRRNGSFSMERKILDAKQPFSLSQFVDGSVVDFSVDGTAFQIFRKGNQLELRQKN